jgi:hypothetical protein
MLRLTTLSGLFLAAGLAQAADNGIYLGAGVTQSDYGLANPQDFSPFDDENNGYKLIAGFRPLDSFGVEANYIDHGKATVPAGIVCTQFITVPCPVTSGIEAKTVGVFAVGYIDLPLVDLFAKAGVSSWDFKVRETPGNTGFSAGDDGTEFAWGAGVQARFGSLGARLEYERFNIIRDEKLGTISLSFTYTFL